MKRVTDSRWVRHILFLAPYIGFLVLLESLNPAAGAAARVIETYIQPPPAPALSAVAAGHMEPHSDYVKITYVSAKGETTGSAEGVYSAGSNTLTVVHSPPAEPGAVGYNIYAIKNNNGSGAGHALQNRTPIPIGIDYTEPEGGWSVSEVLPPVANSAMIPLPRKTVEITQAGGYFEAPQVNGAEAAVVFPSADLRPTTDVSLTAASGLPIGVPGPDNALVTDASRTTVLQTIGFTFDNDLTFAGFPSFKLTLPRNTTAPGPYVLNIYDGSTNSLIAIVPGFYYRNLTFFEDFNATFHAVAYRQYYAELIANSPSASSFSVSSTSSTLKLPSVNGISLTASMPPSSSPLGAYTVYAASMPPTGIPPLDDDDVAQTPYYASVMLAGTAAYSAPITLTATLPLSMLAKAKAFRLAAYDSEYFQHPWSIRRTPTMVDGRTITFRTVLPPFLAWRQYGFALYASNDATRSEHKERLPDSKPLAVDHKPLVFVIGDSISLLTILPPSSSGCIVDWGPIPNCQYSHDPRFNWPSVLAHMTGDHVINVSNLGTQTTVNSSYGESMLSMMVPQVPPDADVVVCQCGVNDLSLNHESPETSTRAAQITNAILARAPHARIIYVGIRCFIGCGKAGVTAWNDAYRGLARKYRGAFIDLMPLARDGASESFPDGSHPTPDTARLIASKVAEAIASFKLSL